MLIKTDNRTGYYVIEVRIKFCVLKTSTRTNDSNASATANSYFHKEQTNRGFRKK